MPGNFFIYINDLIVKLGMSGLGCHLAVIYCGCLFFANDILLSSVSVAQLLIMLNICSQFAVMIEFSFIQKKSI